MVERGVILNSILISYQDTVVLWQLTFIIVSKVRALLGQYKVGLTLDKSNTAKVEMK